MNRLTKKFTQLDNRAVEMLEKYAAWRLRHPKDAEGIRAWEKALYEFFYTVGYDLEFVLNLCRRAKFPEPWHNNKWLHAGEKAQKDWENKKEREDEECDRRLRRG